MLPTATDIIDDVIYVVDDIIYENRDVLTVTGFCALVLWIFFSSVMRLPDNFVTESYVSIIICHAPA